MKGLSTFVLILLIAIIVIAFFTSIFSTVYGSINPQATEELYKQNPAYKKYGSEGIDVYNPPIVREPYETDQLIHLLPGKNPWDPFQPSEIACYIGDVIYNDYWKNGIYVQERRNRMTNCPERSYGIKKECSLNEPKIFTLEEGKYGQLPYSGDDWETALSSRPQGECHLCNQSTTPIPLLDETCVNMQLRDRKVEASDFCNDSFRSRYWPCEKDDLSSECQALPGIEFGNNNCFKPSKNDINDGGKWFDHCNGKDVGADDDYFCDNGKDLIKDWNTKGVAWIADCGGDCDTGTLPKDPFDKVKDKFNYNNPSGILDHDGRRYVFVVSWTENWDDKSDPKQDKGWYNVYFARVPDVVLNTTTNGALKRIGEIVDRNRDDGKDLQYRHSNAGFFSPYARRVVDFLYWGDNTKITDIISEIGAKAQLKTDGSGPGTQGTWDDANCDAATLSSEQMAGEEYSWGCVLFDRCSDVKSCFNTYPAETGLLSEHSSFGCAIAKLMGNKNWLSGSCDCTSQATGGCIWADPQSIVVKSSVDINGNLTSGRLYEIVINNWFDPYWKPTSLGFGQWIMSYGVRTIGILDVTDNFRYCCVANSMAFEITNSAGVPVTDVETGNSIIPSVSNLYYCYSDKAYFYDTTCMGKKIVDMGIPKSSCEVNSQQSLDDTNYCLARQPYSPQPVGCTGGSFAAPSIAGGYTYYSCIDTNSDGTFDKEVQHVLTVKNPPPPPPPPTCPPKCESGLEYRGGAGDVCPYTTKKCNYGCANDNVNCKRGHLCTVDTTTCGCSGSSPCSDTCPTCLQCEPENIFPSCRWTKADCAVFLCFPLCSECIILNFPSGCNCAATSWCGGLVNECCIHYEYCSMTCSIDEINCPKYAT